MSNPSGFNFNFCPNCGWNIDPSLDTCTHCGHKQKTPVLKKPTNSKEMTEAVVVYCTANLHRGARDIIKHERHSFWMAKSKKQAILFEFSLTRLAIGYLIFDTHFQDHPKRGELNIHFRDKMTAHLQDTLDGEGLKRIQQDFPTRIQEYLQCMRREDFLHSLARLYQAHMQAAATDQPFVGADWAMPSITSFMFYEIEVSSFILQLKLFLNRWEVI